MKSAPKHLWVRPAPSLDPAKGLLQFGHHVWPCILGKNGITCRKQEGDMKTPSGRFRLLYGYFRKERTGLISSQLPIKPINETMGWCDDPHNSNYNRPITLPFESSHEKMKHEDGLYDLVVVMDHNYTNRIKNRGSAVFFHLTAEKSYTAGCVAVSPNIMKFLLPQLSQETEMIIQP